MEQKFAKIFRITKTIQLIIVFIIEIIYGLILIFKPTLCAKIFDDHNLFLLFLITWGFLLVTFFFLLYDFYTLRIFATESIAQTRTTYMDRLTGIPNRYGLDRIYSKYTTPESVQPLGCVMYNITNLKRINFTYGKEFGDQIMIDFSNILYEIGQHYGSAARNGGNEYVIIIDRCNENVMSKVKSEVAAAVSKYNSIHDGKPIEVAHVSIINSIEKHETFSLMLTTAYNRLHK